jgi:hypothetical protein
MNMTTGACGSGMRPLWALLGGLLALGGIAGIVAGGVLGAKGKWFSTAIVRDIFRAQLLWCFAINYHF